METTNETKGRIMQTETWSLADVRRVAYTFGAMVTNETVDYSEPSYFIVAPEGKQWAASGTHTLYVAWRKAFPDEHRRALIDAIDDMGEGLEPITE